MEPKYLFTRKDKNAMAFIPVPDVAMVELRMGLDSQRIENTLYFEKAGGWDSASLTALGTSVIVWWDNQMQGLVSNAVAFIECTCTDLSADDAASVTVVPPTALAGGSGDPPMPNNVAIVVSFRTANRGRSARGRNYIAGLPANKVSGNRVIGTYSDSLIAAYSAIVTDVADDQGATWVVASRFHNNAPRAAGVTFPIITVLLADNVLDTQRRRLPGRGT